MERFRIEIPPRKVVLWGSGAPRTTVAVIGAMVIFSRRYRSAAWMTLLGLVWVGLLAALIVWSPPAVALILSVASFFVVFGVRTTETLVVTATPTEGGCEVTITGQAVPVLIRQLERLMATSPTSPAGSSQTLTVAGIS